MLNILSFVDPWESFPLLFGGFIVIFSLFSMVIKEWLFLSEALVATLFGILIGPEGFGFVNPLGWDNIDKVTLEFARVCIALQVFAAGVNLPKAYLVKEWKSLLVLLLPVMGVMWAVTAFAIKFLLNINILEALLIAACVTPTDPVLANSIVRGRFAESHVPLHVRNIISAESGANDGLGFPYLYFPLLILRSANFGSAMMEWSISIWLYQIVLSTIIGAVIGYAALKILYYCQSRELIDKESFLVFGFALSLFIMGCVGIIKSDDLLACFIAGNAFTWDDWFRIEIENTHMQEVVDLFFNLSIFIFFGTIVPWAAFGTIGVYKLIGIAVIVLLFRRVPIVLALKPFTPSLKNYSEAFFAGWFGPIGVGAIFYSMVAREELHLMGEKFAYIKDIVFPVSAFLILSSVIVHGMTVPLFKLSSSIDTRTITNLASITNLVNRLPIIKPGQTVVIERNDDLTTEITVSQVNTPQHTVGHHEYPFASNKVVDTSYSNYASVQDLFVEDLPSNSLKPNRPMSVSLTLTPDGKVIDRHEDYFVDRAAEIANNSRPRSRILNRPSSQLTHTDDELREEQPLNSSNNHSYGAA
ncbi:hypothetical protein K502DRAFT_314043 [Neoconidiobolus thromboides FSU 785]|nr:hypothetical protein K502DRAFT_314043 [Neoconidiobolus thromboides FSU 785]